MTERPPRRPAASSRSMFDRQPPYAEAAEMALLGSLLLEPRLLGEVVQALDPFGSSAFFAPRHQAVFDAMVTVARGGVGAAGAGDAMVFDLVAFEQHLRDQDALARIGGEDYIVELAGYVPVASGWRRQAAIVVTKARLRGLIDACGEILYDCYHASAAIDEGPGSAQHALAEAERRILKACSDGASADLDEALDRPDPMRPVIEAEMARIHTVAQGGTPEPATPTGLKTLDRRINGGLHDGELIIIGARPSMGKSILGAQIALAQATAADGLGRAAFLGFEMPPAMVARRFFASEGRVAFGRIQRGPIHGDELPKLEHAAGTLAPAAVELVDASGWTLDKVERFVTRGVAKRNLATVIVDYLQLMHDPPTKKQGRYAEVSEIARRLQRLARQTGVCVVALAQLNRDSDSRTGGRPAMADLRDSGEIEQAADVMVLIHREHKWRMSRGDEAWLSANPYAEHEAELIIEKQRNGPTGLIKCRFDGALMRFEDVEQFSRGDEEDHGQQAGGPGGAAASGWGAWVNGNGTGPAPQNGGV